VPFEARSARVRDGSAVPYVEHGDPAGTPVLLVHAYADSRRSFEPVLPYLPQSLHVFAPSQRGHGDAEKPSTGYALADLAAELASFLDAVGLPSAVIVGASSGGYVAQRFALDFPERTLGLVLVGAPRSLGDPPAVVAPIAALEDPVDPVFVREFVLATSSERVPADFLETMIGESSKLPAHVWRATLAGLVEAVPPTDTGTIAARTLILLRRQRSIAAARRAGGAGCVDPRLAPPRPPRRRSRGPLGSPRASGSRALDIRCRNRLVTDTLLAV
jgi:rifampin ADP-ribosylating transferase